MLKVIKAFKDLSDNCYKYNVGDVYPHDNIKVSDARIAQLSGCNNRQETPLIANVDTLESPNSAIPAQRSDSVEQETPRVEEEVVAEVKPKRRRKTS